MAGHPPIRRSSCLRPVLQWRCHVKRRGPCTSVGSLTGPSTLAANALNAYTSSAGIDLAASTTYFVLVDSSNDSQNNLQNTASNNEDSGGQSGFSIANGSVYRARAAATTVHWTSYAQSKKIAIKGYAKTGRTRRPHGPHGPLRIR